MAQDTDTGYQVLARKYRPATFADLIGQDAMVRTLKNAFDADRIAHAFVMTGIRGTGKTTTARIIAKGMNCIGPDGQGGPTTDPCGSCEHCVAIAAGRHVDVIEMDAASNTGVNDMREIIDSVHYRAASARFKIYIIDEVHMLSTSAFNALLKTLEEPPEHVKFIFATTEIRKIPVTVLSRCQRFDLRRIEPEVMIGHLERIAGLEKADVAEDALALITRAAEGSVRDAMSLLDQAIAHSVGQTTADQVRAMLGLADRGRVLDLFELVMKGDAAGALSELAAQYADGADPIAVMRDLAEIIHWVSIIKISPAALEDPTVTPDERARGQAFAESLAIGMLSRMWQMLLRVLEEVAAAPNAMMAAEMAIIRLTHVAELPAPEDLMRKLTGGGGLPAGGATGAGPAPGGHGGASPGGHGGGHGGAQGGGAPGGAASGAAGGGAFQAGMRVDPGSGPVAMIVGGGAVAGAQSDPAAALARYVRFDQVVDLIRARRDMKLLMEVETGLRLVSYAPGRIEFEPAENAPADMAARLAQRLQGWTGVRWGVSVVSTGGGRTIAEDRAATRLDMQGQALGHPLVQAVIARFPGAEIRDIRAQEEVSGDNSDIVPIEPDDDWDPFED